MLLKLKSLFVFEMTWEMLSVLRRLRGPRVELELGPRLVWPDFRVQGVYCVSG